MDIVPLALTTLAVGTALAALLDSVIRWDKESEGLLAGTHKPVPVAPAAEADAAKAADHLQSFVADNAAVYEAHLARAGDALAELQRTMLGFREPISMTLNTMQGVARVISRPGIQFTNAHTGAGRYKFTYTEGTISDGN
ncbi:hypothetical protein [Glutamicibacter arilaitensis]|uniref:hypothetical protein n=1 Tax=Glutamicibacter arilaitensis TaxID=256701 RepID=UPI003F8F4CD3